jgi:D-serine deaminase-like pyridoxal phosphate-dependent protein
VRGAERALELLSAARPALLVVGIEESDRRRAIALAARTAGVPWIALTTADAADERVDGGPQPVARVATGEPLARLLAAARGSLGPR